MDQKQVENVQPVLQAKKSYVNDTNSLIPRGKFMVLDSKTMKHLDVIPHAEQSGKHTLFSVMDHTITHMGRRLLRQWICMPLLQKKEIEIRQSFIKYFESNQDVVQLLKTDLKNIHDLERLVASIHVAGLKLPKDHPEQRAVYFESKSYAGKKIVKMLDTLNAFQQLHEVRTSLYFCC